MVLDIDSFSSGQIDSKIWVCEELEKLNISVSQTIWVYGGWYGILSFLLLSRNNLKIDKIRSFDIDASCENIADTINGTWVWKDWKFKAFTEDCDVINIKDGKFGNEPDIIINTSSEHFKTIDWFDNIPVGKLIVIQSNNMIHDDHYSCVSSLDEMKNIYQFNSLLFSGELYFRYPTWEFSRFMLIGKK